MKMPKIENSKVLFENICRKRFKEIYGDNAHDYFTERLNSELSVILQHNREIPFLVTKHIMDTSSKMGYPTFSRGLVGSSFAAFLLGITEINPLEAHYYCPQCKYVKIMQGIADGYDMPDKPCPNCGTPLKGDGHSIPFVSLSGYNGDKMLNIAINVAPSVQEKSKEILQALFPNDKIIRADTMKRDGSRGAHPSGYFIVPTEYGNKVPTVEIEMGDRNIIVTRQEACEISDSFLRMDLLEHSALKILADLSQKSGKALNEIPMNDSDVLALLKTGETEGIPEFGTDFIRKMIAVCKPTCFSDLCKIFGLSHGVHVWTENGQKLIEGGDARLSDILAFREDVYDYLVKADADYYEAYLIMESVRKGRTTMDLDELDFEEYDLPDWFYSSIRKIRYMLPKAHGVSCMQMATQIAWFKRYHKGLFDEVLNKYN